MNIRRDTSGFGLPAGVTEIEMTPEEMSEAYSIKEKEYRKQDIEEFIQGLYEGEVISEQLRDKANQDESITDAIIEWYDKICSCNIAYNASLEEAVMEILKPKIEAEKADDEHYRKLWQEFGAVPMNPETEEIEEKWQHFPAGTDREVIWEWFDENYSKGVSELMFGGGKE